jgi:excisionase family DNA binding protein
MVPSDKQTSRILTVQEVATLLRVHPSTISRFARSGELPSYLVGSRRVFRESDVWSFFENRKDRECAFGKEH